MLTAHQILAIRRALPDAEIDGNIIRTGIWQLQFSFGQLTLPSARQLISDPGSFSIQSELNAEQCQNHAENCLISI